MKSDHRFEKLERFSPIEYRPLAASAYTPVAVFTTSPVGAPRRASAARTAPRTSGVANGSR